MDLEDYWGVGPKTRERLIEALGHEAAIEAIESADVRALADAGLSRGRATRILRRANGGEGIEMLATRDARAVYRQLLTLAEAFALTQGAADRIRILTPLRSVDAMRERLDGVLDARESWDALDGEERAAVVAAFEAYDGVTDGDRAALSVALSVASLDLDAPVFEPFADLPEDDLRAAMDALGALDGGGRVGAGADEELDRLRTARDAATDLAADPESVVEAVQSGARDVDAFREAVVAHVADAVDLDRGTVRESMPEDAVDADAFVRETLRDLVADLRADVEAREVEVAVDLEDAVSTADEAIAETVDAVDALAFRLSLGRFAAAYDLRRPTIHPERDGVAVAEARNLGLLAEDADVQPVTYAVGEHDLEARRPPNGDRVAVLTGANSGGKTTLLETLCQVSLLAQMGLPVPARTAEVGVVDDLVFHRRHASFNAGVLESTLRSVVPPLTRDGRTLMLVDEFEAITEPGRAADLLHGLVTLTVDQDALGVYVTHLAEDLEPLPEAARVDGIVAQGLTPDLELSVDYQPRFGSLGKSTPEFIVSRLLADATDRRERAGFETLAEAVGQAAVQRTLSDARWNEAE